jgi:ubiquinone biosynthesis protein
VGEPIFGMDATQISMGRVLTYLFDVTEQFGMETRTELILLQRTMVVVEGVARSLHPQINIWEVAHPIVEDYIKQSIGPKALMKDLLKTARVLSRFGPKLPQLAEAALIRTYNTSQQGSATQVFKKRSVFLALIGGAALGWLAAQLI